MSDRNDPIKITARSWKPTPFNKYNFNGSTTRGGTKNKGNQALIRDTDGESPSEIPSAKSALYFFKSHSARNTPTIAANEDGNVNFFDLNNEAITLSIIINVTIPIAELIFDDLLDVVDAELSVNPPCKLNKPNKRIAKNDDEVRKIRDPVKLTKIQNFCSTKIIVSS